MNNNLKNNNDYGEIDLLSLFQTLKRNKKTIFLTTILFTSFALIYSKMQSPIYKGTFQIVVKENNKSISDNSIFSNLPSNLNLIPNNFINKNSNKTQEFILKSPSVLNPVYKFNLKEYEIRNDSIKNLSYKKWIKQTLSINFIDKTDILEISFKDKDKKLIFSTLNLISDKYKDFSRRDRQKNISKSINYLESQQKKLRPEVTKAFKNLNKFSLDNGLSGTQDFISSYSAIDSERSSEMKSNLDVSNKQRINSSPQNKLRFKNQFAKLESYETLYTDLSSKLKPNSNTLIELKNKIETLKLSLKRPSEILIKYRELSKEALRKEKSLIFIEDSLAILKLESAKQQDPWELISIPTLEDDKVSPNTLENLVVTIFISILLSSIIILIRERKMGYIYNFEQLESSLKCKYLSTLYSSNLELSNLIFKNLAKAIDLKIEKLDLERLGIIYLNDTTKELFPLIDNMNFNYCELKDNKKIKEFEKIIFIICKGDIKNSDLILINEYIKLFKDKLIGWILLEK